MRALITGATGFIGSHLAALLHQKNYTLRCLVRRTSNLAPLEGLPVDFVYGDLFDQEAMRSAVAGVDVVYHLAGVTKARTKEEYFRGNQTATRNLLEAVIAANPGLKRFIHVSSQAAVGPGTNELLVDETTPAHPITTYGLSKHEAERECLKLADRLPITIVRPPAVYGPRDKDVFAFFDTMNKGLQPLIGFGKKEVSLIHVTDLVRGIVLAGEHPAAAGRIYFIASEKFYNWLEVGDTTSKILGKKVFRVRIPETLVFMIAGIAELWSMVSRKAVLLNWEKAKDIVQDYWTCSIDKARTELGFRESLTLEEGIRNTVTWYKEQGWLK